MLNSTTMFHCAILLVGSDFTFDTPYGVLEQCAMLQCKRLTRLKTAWSRPHGAVWPRLTAASQYNILSLLFRAQNTYLQIMNNIEAQKNCGPDQNRFWKLDHRSAILAYHNGLLTHYNSNIFVRL